MQNQLATTAFVYVQKRAPYKSVCVDIEEARDFYQGNPKWSHTATIEPRVWIAYLLNHPEERTKMIEEMFKP